ncbi:MAG: radical SAM protein [Clostridiales Family XIII bacterium]|jgi:nitrogen fixation protein NifB|nr:radical SAM protein [Clostridiales Family XIII bacterium]
MVKERKLQTSEYGAHRRDIANLHPCFGAAKNKGRMHLPICPACNIECAFCKRSLNDNEVRPGVASFILPADKAADYVDVALAKTDSISVVGVAGPGDTLVGDNLFKAFGAIHDRHPELLKCISTNGLLLSERAGELIELGIDTLTVTVNAVDPQILSKIVLAIRWHGKRYEGMEAAMIQIGNQLEGIEKMAAAGTTIKVNTVLIPGLNDLHIPEIARRVSEAGAAIYNIIPLIPQHRLSHYAEPTCEEIETARQKASVYIDVFRHCQRCRADAIGIPGLTDHAAEVLGSFAGQAEDVFSHG